MASALICGVVVKRDGVWCRVGDSVCGSMAVTRPSGQ